MSGRALSGASDKWAPRRQASREVGQGGQALITHAIPVFCVGCVAAFVKVRHAHTHARERGNTGSPTHPTQLPWSFRQFGQSQAVVAGDRVAYALDP